jgi:hypothetical protein
MTKTEQRKELVRQILKECSTAVEDGVGNKTVGAAARRFWVTRGTRSIARQVKRGTNWNQAKKRVLPSAKKMGKLAAVLAGDLKVIPPWAAEGAAAAIRHDRKCPPGRGGFCP